ncbi:MAG: hypothetical protein KJ042_01110 [Deltaproteobacteria bacterium]|nr:hypothetical protein [Deltaproteobacteria bacterium]
MKKLGTLAVTLALMAAFVFAVGFASNTANAVAKSDTIQNSDRVATMVSDQYLTDHSPMSRFERRQAINFRAQSNNLRVDGVQFHGVKSLKTISPKK